MLKAIIFDMDGILLDSESLCDKNWIIAQREMGLDLDSTMIEKCRGTNKQDTRRILMENYGSVMDVDKFMARTSELFHAYEEKYGVPEMPFAKDAVDTLSKKFRLALASSTRGENVRRQLKNAGLLDYFEILVTGDMVEHSKPNPQIYQMAVQGLKLNCNECLAIEDSPNGIKSAFSAGVPVIMVPDRIKPTEETNKMVVRTVANLDEACGFILNQYSI